MTEHEYANKTGSQKIPCKVNRQICDFYQQIYMKVFIKNEIFCAWNTLFEYLFQDGYVSKCAQLKHL